VGQNVFTIRVIDTAGNITEKTLTVNYSGTAAPSAPEPSGAGFELFVIAVIMLVFVILLLVFRFEKRRK